MLWFPCKKLEHRRERILEASEAPPVSSFTLASKKGVSALPIIFLSLMIQCEFVEDNKILQNSLI